MIRCRAILPLTALFLSFFLSSYGDATSQESKGNSIAVNDQEKESIVTKTLEKEEGKKEKVDITLISEAFGHLIGENLDSLGVEFDMNSIIKGLTDSLAGKKSPMKENDCIQAISTMQEESLQKLAKKNLSEADEFMIGNSKKQGIVEIEKNKLQYKIEKAGNGQFVEEHFSPLIRYTGRFMNGEIFGQSQEDQRIILDEAISGFRQGIIGMKEGEKRTLFVHPDCGYGTTSYLPPNSLLVFEVEVVKANIPEKKEPSTTLETAKEIAEITKENTEEKSAIR